jgi:methylenetetrahydrofolate dehydrogenase (NADP+)/methenyltetrahydrofolate cyclohydrolase
MKIIGRDLAREVYEEINTKLVACKNKKITPHLVIVKSLNIDAVNNYIHQKVKRGKKIGVEVEVLDMGSADCKDSGLLTKKIEKLNKSKKIHGIIFQKPSHVNVNDNLEKCISPQKDVDGFLTDSFHLPPVYRGVIKVLSSVFQLAGKKLITLLATKNIVLIGKGKTGGRTIISGLMHDGYDLRLLTVIDSKTTEKEKGKIIRKADIIISAVGKLNPVDFHLFPKRAILVDIGVHFSDENKIQGDFCEDDIKEKVAYYTTTPGGLGALTVAYLMDNTVNSALNSFIHLKK